MSQNSSVAVLADCSDLYNSQVPLMGLNGTSSVLSIENETILTDNTNISPSQVISSVSFLERVHSTDLATLFPRGSLNQKMKKKKKSRENSLSNSQSSQHVSSLQSNMDVMDLDENESTSFDGCSEKMEHTEEPSKPFNKCVYLKKKSVNISFDSGSLNNSISEKSLRSRKIVNSMQTDEYGSNKFENEEKPAKGFNKRSYLKKKSVNISFDLGSSNNSVVENSLEKNEITNISLASKRKNLSRRNKLNSVLNIDNMESLECSKDNSKTKKAKSITTSDVSCSKTSEGITKRCLRSMEVDSFDENISKDNKTDDSLKTNDEESAKVFNKNLYLKKKSINVSFDSSSLNNSMVEKRDENNQIADVHLDPLSSKLINVTESAESVATSFEGSQKMDIEEESAKLFNKNLYLKKKSINVSFDSTSLNHSMVEERDENNQVAYVPLDPLSSKISESAENVSKDLVVHQNISDTKNDLTNINVSNVSINNASKIDSVSIIEEAKNNSAREGENHAYILKNDSLKALNEKAIEQNCTEGSLGTRKGISIPNNSGISSSVINEESKEYLPISGEENNFDKVSSNDNITIDDNCASTSDNSVHIPCQGSNSVGNNLEKNDEVILSTNSAKKNSKNNNSELIDVQYSYSTNDSINVSKSFEIDIAAAINKEINKSTIESGIYTNDSSISIVDKSAKLFNKNLYLKKKSINVSFDSSSLNNSMVDKRDENNQVDDIPLDPLSPKIINVTESAESITASFGGSQKLEIEEKSVKEFNKNVYLKKKSINVSFDSSSLNDSMVEKRDENNQIADVHLDPLTSKLINVTESAESVATSFEGSQKMEIEEESAKEFNKNLYLKKKSINVSFDSTSLNDSMVEKRDENNQIADVHLDPLTSKLINVTESAESVATSFEGSQKMEIEEESAKEFNKNLYLKKKSINVSFDSSSLNNSMVEERDENNQVADVHLDPLSPKIINVTESAESIIASFGESQKLEIEDKSAKEFNKNLYLKKKSVNVSFDSTSLSGPIPEKSIQEKSLIANSLDLAPSKTTIVTESAETASSCLEGSQKMEIEEESANVFNKNLYLKKKSVNVSFDSTSLNGPIPEKSIQEKSLIANSLDLAPSKITNVTESAETASSCFEGSQKTEIEAKSANVFNKNLYLKKTSVNVSFDSTSLNGPIPEKSIQEKSLIANSLDLAPSKITNVTESAETASSCFEGSQKTEIEAKSANVFNKNLYLKKTPVNVSFDTSPLIDSMIENRDENSPVADAPSDSAPSKIVNITESAESVVTSFEGSQKTETEEKCSKLFNKNLNSEKSLEKNSHVANVSDPLTSKITNVTESAEHVSKELVVHQNISDTKNDITDGNLNVSNVSINNASKIDSVSIIEEAKNNSPRESENHDNIFKNDSLKALNEKAVEHNCSEGNLGTRNGMLISSNSGISCSVINDESKECRPISGVDSSFNKVSSNDNIIIEDNCAFTPDSGTHIPCQGSKSLINSVGNDLGKNDEVVLSKDSVKRKSNNDNTELIDVQNISDTKNDLTNGNINMSNVAISNASKIDSVNIIDEVKNNSAKESKIHANILKNDSLKALNEKAVDQNCSEGNLGSRMGMLISSNGGISCNVINEESKECLPISGEENSFNKVSSKDNITIKDNCAFTSDSSTHITCQGSKSLINSVGNNLEKNDQVVLSRKSARKNSKNDNAELIDVQINLSKSSETDNVAIVDKRNNKITESSMRNKVLINKSSKIIADKDSNSILLRSAKKNKTILSENETEDFIPDISVIPNPRPVTRSKVMYHSTPINRTFNKKNRSKLKGSSNIQVEDKNIQQDDKMIQVSKSIFGSSTEVTTDTMSKKKSLESCNSSLLNEKSVNRTKRKSDSHHNGIKKIQKTESIGESRSYHSNFLSTFEDDRSYCTTRKSVKRVAFKSISSYENSTSRYENSSDDYTSRNRKSVGFRDAISLIEDTIGNSSGGEIRDANTSDLSIVVPNSIKISDMPGTINDSKSRIDRTDMSLNYSAEVPEIILTENEIECNEMSKECSLFNKLIEMAENKKSSRNMATRQSKLSKGWKMLGSPNLVISHAMSDLAHEKWVSPNLIKFLNSKLMTDALDHVINTERIVSVLCSAVSGVRNLQDANDIDFALLPLKNILLKFRVCSNMIEYCTFISRFTPFEFQRKALPLEGYFGSIKRGIKKKLTDPILTETEKMNVFL